MAEARRVRFRFSKTGKVRFTSHRDVARMWERALRRSRLPVALSQGFSPPPLLSFGLALPTGCESRGEYLDARLDADAGAGQWHSLSGADIRAERVRERMGTDRACKRFELPGPKRL